MRLLKQALAALGTVVVVAVIVALIAPKTVHAVVAAAVEVMNTSANPVPMYDSGTRFQADICAAFSTFSIASGFCGSNTSGSFVVPTVTSGGATVKRLVVDNVSGYCSSFNNPAFFVKTVRLAGQFVPDSAPNGATVAAHYVPIVGPAYSYVNDPSLGPPLGGVQETDYTYGQNTHFSFNPGDTVSINYFGFFPGTGANDVGCLARIEGFFVTQ